MFRSAISIIIVFFLYACSTNQEERLAKLDKVYGYCDNPHRGISGREYEICIDKERAAGPDGVVGDSVDVLSIFSNIGGAGQATIIGADTNNFLWDASLAVLGSYSLKLSDYDGGYIETNWIINKDNPSQRCLIKSHIKSNELVSNGVKVTLLCENKIDEEWYSSNEDFVEEEKQLTIKILQEAASISSSNLS